MKHHRLLFFLQKVGIISFIIVAMLCTTVHKSFALTDKQTSSESTVASDEDTNTDKDKDKDKDKDSDEDSDKSVKSSEQAETPDSIETPGEDNTDHSQDTSDTSEKSDNTDDTLGEGTKDDTTQSDGQDPSEDPSDSQTSESTDTPEVSDDTEDTKTEINTEKKPSSTPTKPSADKQINTSTSSEVSTSKNTKIRDESADAIYIRSNFTPSETFIALKDRVKYNEALPLDNIPSFITQEMIIGALHCQDETGYPASVTIAQIIQESGFGEYGPGGEDEQGLSYLAYQYSNLFGIKGTGTAGSVNMRTGEQTSAGITYSVNADFRVYNTYTECIEDRTKLITEVYSDLIDGVKDANTFAMRIGSRWATSITYSQNLIQQMERYDLYRLDRMTLKDFHEMIGTFSNPCPGSYVTSSFGYREFDHMFHKGIDLGTNQKSIPVYAAESGTIIRSEYDNLAGNWIMIDHGNGLVTKYMHLSHSFIKEGQKVIKGQQIGLTGTTGNSTGIHLHFQVEENGVAVDPTTYYSDF